jgi:hypothetical protein
MALDAVGGGSGGSVGGLCHFMDFSDKVWI